MTATQSIRVGIPSFSGLNCTSTERRLRTRKSGFRALSTTTLLQELPKGFAQESYVMTELLVADWRLDGSKAVRESVQQWQGRIPNSVPVRYLLTNSGL